MHTMDADPSRILVKTDKGLDEVKHRTYGLSLAQRSLLIMADGMTSIANMLTRTAQLPKSEENLSWLMSEGFVESVMPSQQGAPVRPAAAPAAPRAAGISHKQALIAITREVLGPDAQKVLQRVDDVPDNLPDLLSAVERCHKFIKLTIDEAKAEQFLKACRSELARD